MDGVSPMENAATMPSRSPLPMAKQEFHRLPENRRPSRKTTKRDTAWRFAAFAPAIAVTVALCTSIAQWFAGGGVTPTEATVVVLMAATFIWVSLSVSTAALALIRRALRPCLEKFSRDRGPAQRIALLMPIYNEVPWDVFGNAAATLNELSKGPQRDRYDLFVLSDTQDPEIAELEARAFEFLRVRSWDGIGVYYRRRDANTDKKVGNLADWIENWGGAYDAMLILDADSLMSGAAIRHLAHEMAADPDAGLIQSFPTLIRAHTLFGRMLEFSNAAYGWIQAEGQALWAQRESNYWGHNAIIRTAAFAESARLPYLRGRRGRKDLILSHDFVEAGMLRRAGWGVRFLPRAGGSYEETPQTLIDYALRDRRWCQGNLQHLRILAARGFHPMSRFHLLQGALAFLMSPAWFALIVIWALIGTMPEGDTSYFDVTNPLFPSWPMTETQNGVIYLAVIYAMLLTPKVTGAFALGLRPQIQRSYKGTWRFWATTLFEIFCSIVYAPVLMVQQTVAVLLSVAGRAKSWRPQERGAKGYSWLQTLRFHWLETVLGAVLLSGIFTEALSLWLLPVAVSLCLAVPLSKLSAVSLDHPGTAWWRLNSPQALRTPRVVRKATLERRRLKDLLTGQVEAAAIAAE
ncbi:MAG: glucans biosynthesis glucosyltransferase MdoH [Pseudomonadota bacterium]